MRTRPFVIAGIAVALLIAGVGSYFASSDPDGLQHVAEQIGFAQQWQESPASDSPLSGYEVKGVQNDAVSGGLAGMIGAFVVLLLTGGLAYAIRRKPEHEAHDSEGDTAGPVGDRPRREGD